MDKADKLKYYYAFWPVIEIIDKKINELSRQEKSLRTQQIAILKDIKDELSKIKPKKGSTY